MSSLHIWFSKLKWSLDVLLRFYERHAFICALHKVEKLLQFTFFAFVSCVSLTKFNCRRQSYCLMSWFSASRGCTVSHSTWTCPSTTASLRRSPRWRCTRGGNIVRTVPVPGPQHLDLRYRIIQLKSYSSSM